MKLMVLDGNSMINRSFYGVRPLTTRDGLPTHAVYGFVTTLLRLLDEENPEALCVTFDRREPTFRHLLYDGYKATRKGMPEELARQMPVLKEVLAAMDVPCFELAGYEADDLIGTISRRCEAENWECVVVTGDKDSLQLITAKTKVKLIATRMGQTTTTDMTEAVFRELYGFDPIHMIDLKALMGDSSDNIPGVPGVGEKTAMALVRKYRSIETIFAELAAIEVTPNIRKKLEEGRDSAELSYRLATIDTAVPLTFAPADQLRRPCRPELYPLFLRLEFKKLIDRMGLTARTTPAGEQSGETTGETEAVTVTTEAQAEELLRRWRGAKEVFVLALPDLNTIGVYWEQDEAHAVMAEFYFHRYQGDWNALLTRLFSADIPKVSCGVKDLMRTLLENGFPAEGFRFDVSLAAYLLDATAGHYELERLFSVYCHAELPSADRLRGMGGEQDLQAQVALRCHTTAIAAVYEAIAPQLAELSLTALFDDIEMPLCRVLAEMEIAGFRVDVAALRQYGARLSDAIAQLEQKIYSYAGAFNIKSPRQLGEVLFERLRLPSYKKTKTGYSTNAEVLDKLRGMHPIVEDVLSYRQYAKLKSTYVDGLLKVISPDSRVRTSFQMMATATGRLSSAEPNLQNIPTRTELGSELRRMFVPAPDRVLVDADYSQIELRILAHISGDTAMQQAFLSGEDFHTVTASHVFDVPLKEVTPSMRRAAKAVNFGIVYGISSYSLSQDLNVSVAEARRYMDAYFARFPGVKRYMEQVVETAREQGYVTTLYGRRRALPEITASNFATRSFGERVALNMPIQGTAADIIKLAMVRVHDALRPLSARLIMQVHDELLVECPPEESEQVKTLLSQEMERVFAGSVPLVAEAHSGMSWLDAK